LKTAPTKVIGFMTDFDVKDDAVGICKAVMDGVAPGVRIIDITHQSEPYNIAMGARFLAGSAPYFPKDAVFVVVIDPGVGSTRKAIIAKSRAGQFFVLPDNGLLTLIQDRDGIAEAHEITNPAWMIGSGISSTFHGRDIFSPAGAHLARGDDWTPGRPRARREQAGPPRPEERNVDGRGLHGQVIGTDGPFGNLVLNVPAETFAQLGYKLGDQVPVTLAGKSYVFPFVKTFSDVPVGKELFYIDSRGRWGWHQPGQFFRGLQVGAGAELTIPLIILAVQSGLQVFEGALDLRDLNLALRVAAQHIDDAGMICRMDLLGARRRAEEAGSPTQLVLIGLDGKGCVPGVRVRLAIKGGHQVLNGNCICLGNF
jgi:S-adenosylmethionine hydrolase